LRRRVVRRSPGHIVSIGASGDDRGAPGGYEATRKLLGLKRIPDGIFCFNDPIALGAMRAILDAGLRIPEDIAVVGCGNVLYSDFLRVPLSSIDQDSAAIGRHAAELALALVHAKSPVRRKTLLLTPTLVVRALVAALVSRMHKACFGLARSDYSLARTKMQVMLSRPPAFLAASTSRAQS
jgi:DNA-binding LacI/PurR family transcriptional regulator